MYPRETAWGLPPGHTYSGVMIPGYAAAVL